MNMNKDISALLEIYNKNSDEARRKLNEKLGKSISSIDFQIAFGSLYGYEQFDSYRVWEHALSTEKMLELLNEYEFYLPEEIGHIFFEESILPDNVIRVINEQEIRDNGEVWVIHRYDQDPFPSNPHAHNKETGYKLHLGNGDLYTYKNKYLGERISKKHLIDIRNKVKNMNLPLLTV